MDKYMDNKHFIEVKNISFSYDDEDNKSDFDIDGLSLTVDKGEFVAILGANGSGKSTLAKLLNLILAPKSGEIYIDGFPITKENLTEKEIIEIRKDIGMVFQNPDNQLVATIVEEDVAFGPENLGISPEEIRERVDNALETVGMSEYKRHSPHQLSGGQKQRIAIAGIIAMMPRCIVFDESTAMLDPHGRKEVMDTIIKLNREKGITVIAITHYMNEALLADRVIVMNDGEIIMNGKPDDVFRNVNAVRAAGLDVPQQYELIHELKKAGFEIKEPSSLSIDDCAQVIYDYYKESSKQ